MMRRAFVSVPLVLSSILGACHTTDKGAATGETVDQAATEIGQSINYLDSTLLALKQLVEKPAPDLTPQFKAYTENLVKLESTAKGVSALAAKIATRSQEYFVRWDEQIAEMRNENIRERSAERREVISNGFTKIQKEFAEVRAEFKPLLSDLRDVRSGLSNDLTLDGLKSIEGVVGDVAAKSDAVRESLKALEMEFQELGVKLRRSGPPAEPPPS